MVWKLHRVKEVSFEIWRGAKLVSGVPPLPAPLVVQTLSVTAHMLFFSDACFSYGPAHSNSLQTW